MIFGVFAGLVCGGFASVQIDFYLFEACIPPTRFGGAGGWLTPKRELRTTSHLVPESAGIRHREDKLLWRQQKCSTRIERQAKLYGAWPYL